MLQADLPPATSSSQLTTFAACPRRYGLRYVHGAEPEFRSVALVLGSAVHSAIQFFFEEKLAGRTPAIADAERILVADLAAECEGTPVRWKDDTPESLEAQGRRLVELYLSRNAELPVVKVEEPFEIDLEDSDSGEVRGRRFKGSFDLVLADERVVEIKTSSRAWSDFDLIRHVQAGGYAYAYNTLHGGPCEVDVHVLVKTKQPRLEVFEIRRGEPATRWWLRAAWAIEGAISARQFPPNPGPLCGSCEHERTCAEWTGEALDLRPVRRLPLLAEASP